MSVLDNFVDEMLQSEVPKRVLIERLIRGLDIQKPPTFTIPAPKYTFETNLHGLQYDYAAKTVTISYKVAPTAYPDMTVSFTTWRAVLEGIALCIRMQKW